MSAGARTALALLAAALWPAAPALAQTESPDYAQADTWLCRPGRQDLCAVPLERAVVQADGSASVERLAPDPAALVDCFYVYPTISQDPNGNSGLAAGPGERRAVEQQFAAFASVCRPFAPMYRQVTLAGLRSLMAGRPMAIDPELGYRDVLAAWRHYLAHDNQGRGVVLVGHSQGSRMLMQLLQREIEGSPAQALLVSALIPGLNVELPTGRDTGGTFKQLPACGTPAQTGCIVAYASFRADAPPPDNARFGRSRKDGTTVACVDPVALTGGTVQGWLPVRSNLLGQALDVPQWPQWQAMAKALNAPFVALPGLTRARCVADGPNHFLAVSFQAGPDGRRPADLPADILANGKPLADWGLHLVDLNLVGGNLLQLVRQQSAAWVQAHPAAK